MSRKGRQAEAVAIGGEIGEVALVGLPDRVRVLGEGKGVRPVQRIAVRLGQMPDRVMILDLAGLVCQRREQGHEV